jgi:hypothetical protein
MSKVVQNGFGLVLEWNEVRCTPKTSLKPATSFWLSMYPFITHQFVHPALSVSPFTAAVVRREAAALRRWPPKVEAVTEMHHVRT